MDLLDLYHKNLRQPIDSEEEGWVSDVIESYPYFSLPYYILARKSGDQEDVFKAATHAPNRSLLRNYMEGRSVFETPAAPTPKKDEPKITLRKNRPVEKELAYAEHEHHQLFSLLDFNELSQPAFDAQEPLSIYTAESKRKFDAFVNVKVKELSVRYLYLIEEIHKQIDIRLDKSTSTAPVQPQKESIILSDHTSKHQEPVIPTSKTKAKSKAKNRENLFSPAEERPVSDVSGMLDRFLQSRPSPKEMLARAQDAFDENAVGSVSRDDDMVTETLAKLNVKQGNFKEALRIYRKLRLLFPEKSAYFDGQIELIEQKI